jgi:cell division septation protein DedD
VAPPPAAAPRDAVQTSGSSGAATATTPAAKPTQLAAAPAAAPKPAEKPPAKATPAAAPPAGAFRVQLVSVKAENQTKEEWARLQRTYPQLAPLKMSVTRVDLGEKGVWYRIFAGPLSDAAAGDLCHALKAKGQGCVVVKS